MITGGGRRGRVVMIGDVDPGRGWLATLLAASRVSPAGTGRADRAL
jgi:hypothetical protein